jgi:soluble lytic murein transglycosylase-like protein
MAKRLMIWGGTLAVAVLCSLTPSDSRVEAQSAEVAAAIDHAAATTGVSPRFLYCLAGRESTFRPWAVGDGGLSHGLMQFRWGTWNAYAPRYGFVGYSPYDAWAAAHVAAGMIRDGMRSHWPPARWCGSHWW